MSQTDNSVVEIEQFSLTANKTHQYSCSSLWLELYPGIHPVGDRLVAHFRLQETQEKKAYKTKRKTYHAKNQNPQQKSKWQAITNSKVIDIEPANLSRLRCICKIKCQSHDSNKYYGAPYIPLTTNKNLLTKQQEMKGQKNKSYRTGKERQKPWKKMLEQH